MTTAEVGREIGCSSRTVKRITAGQGKREERQTRWRPGERRLSVQEREEISLGVRRGDSFAAMGRQLGRSTSTVSREVNANGGRGGYRAWRAHDRAFEAARRPKKAKLDCPRLAGQVTMWLEAAARAELVASHDCRLVDPLAGQRLAQHLGRASLAVGDHEGLVAVTAPGHGHIDPRGVQAESMNTRAVSTVRPWLAWLVWA